MNTAFLIAFFSSLLMGSGYPSPKPYIATPQDLQAFERGMFRLTFLENEPQQSKEHLILLLTALLDDLTELSFHREPKVIAQIQRSFATVAANPNARNLEVLMALSTLHSLEEYLFRDPELIGSDYRKFDRTRYYFPRNTIVDAMATILSSLEFPSAAEANQFLVSVRTQIENQSPIIELSAARLYFAPSWASIKLFKPFFYFARRHRMFTDIPSMVQFGRDFAFPILQLHDKLPHFIAERFPAEFPEFLLEYVKTWKPSEFRLIQAEIPLDLRMRVFEHWVKHGSRQGWSVLDVLELVNFVYGPIEHLMRSKDFADKSREIVLFNRLNQASRDLYPEFLGMHPSPTQLAEFEVVSKPKTGIDILDRSLREPFRFVDWLKDFFFGKKNQPTNASAKTTKVDKLNPMPNPCFKLSAR